MEIFQFFSPTKLTLKTFPRHLVLLKHCARICCQLQSRKVNWKLKLNSHLQGEWKTLRWHLTKSRNSFDCESCQLKSCCSWIKEVFTETMTTNRLKAVSISRVFFSVSRFIRTTLKLFHSRAFCFFNFHRRANALRQH